ncbi:hypothetical protein MKW98_003553 [Papaver atlanticum]|uniref:PHL domain-containing protein n=1 Tax=Papaver atlanticum TaxID=357466 RepID=A0AAD4XTN7_9MAGN|nr:hypothetical protein MKW98_003553 [Papaver atlanticum]
MSVPLNANSPSVGTPPLADQSILDKFAKIETVAQRYQLNCKKNKVDNFPPKKPVTHSSQQLQLSIDSKATLFPVIHRRNLLILSEKHDAFIIRKSTLKTIWSKMGYARTWRIKSLNSWSCDWIQICVLHLICISTGGGAAGNYKSVLKD